MSAIDRYVSAARAAGCPRDQIENFIRAGVVLQPTQLRASAAARLCDLPDGPTQMGYGGARGGGKSHLMLTQMAVDDCQRAPGLKCLLLRKVGKANRENFEDLRQRVLPGVPNEYKRQQGVLVFPNGSRIILGHFQNEGDIDAYLGLEYDVIGLEEATTLSSSKNKAIGTCCRTSKPGWRPRRYYTTNPGGVGHTWFKDLFIEPLRKGLEGDTRFIHATADDNPFLNVEYRRVLDSLTGWQLKAWRYGDWDIAAGQFFTTFARDIHVIKPFEIPVGWRKGLGLDYGFTHYTSGHLCAEDGDGNVYAVDEHCERRWLPERHAKALDSMLARHNLTPARMWRIVAGADVFAKKEHGGTIADSYQTHGYKLTPANDDRINGAAEILTRLGDRDAGIPPRLFIFDRCARLADCIPSLEHDPHRPEDVLKVDTDDDGKGGDDPYDSFRYAVMMFARPKIGTPTAGAPPPLRKAQDGFMTGLTRG